ncbi:stalk domain-containing protein [Paenibacillus medicaginis]|uniref:Stalk domain-containing protein n=1 Tax=Paenibacillus medicaginis TaxID=1470560 RepID=A0ABV5C933_9BACL
MLNMLNIKQLSCTLLLTLVSVGTTAAAADTPSLKLVEDGTEVITELPPQIVDGHVMIPIRTAAKLWGKNIKYDEKAGVVEVSDRMKVIWEDKSKGIKLSGSPGEDGMYKRMGISTPNFTRNYLPIESVTTNRDLQVTTTDLTGDGEEEIIVITNIGYGTGLSLSDLVVLDAHGGSILHEDPLIAMMKQFTGRITEQGVKVNLNGKVTKISKAQIAAEPSHLFGPGIGSILYYSVENNTLHARAAVQISPAEFIGDLRVSYVYKNGILQAGQASFEPYPEYQSN